jgi:hypothetical protein
MIVLVGDQHIQDIEVGRGQLAMVLAFLASRLPQRSAAFLRSDLCIAVSQRPPTRICIDRPVLLPFGLPVLPALHLVTPTDAAEAGTGVGTVVVRLGIGGNEEICLARLADRRGCRVDCKAGRVRGSQRYVEVAERVSCGRGRGRGFDNWWRFGGSDILGSAHAATLVFAVAASALDSCLIVKDSGKGPRLKVGFDLAFLHGPELLDALDPVGPDERWVVREVLLIDRVELLLSDRIFGSRKGSRQFVDRTHDRSPGSQVDPEAVLIGRQATLSRGKT